MLARPTKNCDHGVPLKLLERLSKSCIFMGYFLKDEPSAQEFSELVKRKTLLESHLYNDKPVICNLLPNHASHEQLGVSPTPETSDPAQKVAGIDTSEYEGHIQKYLDIFKPRFLCYDHYPITDSLRAELPRNEIYIYRYMANLSSMQKAADMGSIPFYNVIQAWGFCDSMLSPNIFEYRWMVNTSIALGARGKVY